MTKTERMARVSRLREQIKDLRKNGPTQDVADALELIVDLLEDKQAR